MQRLLLQKFELLCSRWIGQALFKWDWHFVWTWDYVQIVLIVLLPVVVMGFVLWMLVRALWHFHEKKNPIPQGVGHLIQEHKTGKTLLTFLCKALLTLIGFLTFTIITAPVALADSPEIDEINQPQPPLLADGSTAPELSLRPPTSIATGSPLNPEAGPSTSSGPSSILEEVATIDQLYEKISRQLKNIWDKEADHIKNELFPIYSGGTREGYKALLKGEIRRFLQERFPDSDPAQLKQFREELMPG